MEYDDYGYGNQQNQPSKEDIGGWVTILLPLGIIIALCANGTRWIDAFRNYFLNLFHHPTQLFHLDTVLFLGFTFLIAYKICKRIFFR